MKWRRCWSCCSWMLIANMEYLEPEDLPDDVRMCESCRHPAYRPAELPDPTIVSRIQYDGHHSAEDPWRRMEKAEEEKP